MIRIKILLIVFIVGLPFPGYAGVSDTVSAVSEVIPKTSTQVIVRDHPKTGKPYVSIVSDSAPGQDPFAHLKQNIKRPDYRMLDPQVKSGEIPYEGPVSDRKKVYILAASLATLGTVGGVAVIAAAPAATGAGAAGGGAGMYAAGGAAVVLGTAAGTVAVTKTDPDKENFTHESEANLKKV